MRKKHGGNTVEIVTNFAKPIAESLNLELWDVRFLKEGTQWYLRIYIDKGNGVSIEDCENMSRAIDKVLDDVDPIDQSYCLEVCSPGLERELIRDWHLRKYIGDDVKVRFIRSNDDGKKEILGKLKYFDKEKIELIDSEGQLIEVLRKNVSSIKLDDFDKINNLGDLENEK